jgi:hypothetical protein
MTLWFHLPCGAYKRPGPFLEACRDTEETIEESELSRLLSDARRGLEHERLARLNGAERASTGRATCRSCREPIPKGQWRISLVFYDEEEGRFSPAGFIHPRCSKEYFGTADLLPQLRHFSSELSELEMEEIRSLLTE